MEMNLERLERSQARVNFLLSAQEVDRALEKNAREVSKKVKIPGFRPGRAPSKMVEAVVGKEALRGEALQEILTRAFVEAAQEHKLAYLNQPRFDYEAEDLQWGKEFSFQVTMDLEPEVELGTYKGITMEKKLQPVDDKLVDQQIQSSRERYSELVPSEKTKTEDGDYAKINLIGKIGDEVVPGTELVGYPVHLGQGFLEPELDAAIVGMEIDEKKIVSIEYPQEHPSAEVAGKTIDFSVELVGIEQREYPDLDDDFAQNVSGCDTLAEWKEQIRGQLEQNIASQAEQKLYQDLVDKVVEESKTELPPFTLETYQRGAEQRMRIYLSYQGIQWEDYIRELEADGKTSQEVIVPLAEKELKQELVLLAIAKAEKLTPSTEELEAKIAQLKQSHPKEEEAELVSTAQYQLLLEGARKFIRDQAQVQEVLVQQEEGRGEEDEHTDTHGGGTE